MTNTAGFFLLGLMGVTVGGFIMQARNPVGFSRMEADFFDLFSPSDVPYTPAESESPAPAAPAPVPFEQSPLVKRLAGPALHAAAKEETAVANAERPPAAPTAKAPTLSPGTAATPESAAPASAPSPALWAPPAAMPAKPNWTWTTTDGHTYKNVVVQKIDPAKVTILDDNGGATVAIATLPPNLQKQLNYVPDVADASAAVSSSNGFNYYTMSAAEKAKVVAEHEDLPLAWLCGYAGDLAPDAAQSPQSTNGLTQMALAALQGRAVIIFNKAETEMDQLPADVHAQLFTLDDGPIPGGHHFIAPKIIFTSGDGTKMLGRAWYTKMKTDREGAINSVLNSIGSGSK